MKKYMVCFITLILFINIFSEDEIKLKKIKEEITVLNFEVPVRVFFKNKPVDNLKIDDFILFEGGKRVKITGFYKVKRRLKTEEIKIRANLNKEKPLRYFILVFNVSNYNKQLKEGIEFLFDNVIKDNDKLLVIVNNRMIFLNKRFLKIKRRDVVIEVVKEECMKARFNLYTYFLKIRENLIKAKTILKEKRDTRVEVLPRGFVVINFLNDYINTWKEYKKNFLVPNLDSFYEFSNFVKKIKGEKWVLNFYQYEMFPKLKLVGEIRQKIEELISELQTARSEDSVKAQIINNLIDRINREMNVAEDIPTEEIAKLFINVGVSYYTFFMSVLSEDLSQDLEYKRISTNIENSFREITKKSGGILLNSSNLSSALHKAITHEDIYYVLTYKPQTNVKKDIKIVLKDKKYKLFYDNRIRKDYIEDYIKKKNIDKYKLKIFDVFFKDKELVFFIKDYKFIKSARKGIGKIGINIEIKDKKLNKIFSQTRIIKAKKKQVKIRIKFDWLKQGDYYFFINAKDLFTLNSKFYFLEVYQ